VFCCTDVTGVARSRAADVVSGDTRCAHGPGESQRNFERRPGRGGGERHRGRWASTCWATSTRAVQRRQRTRAGHASRAGQHVREVAKLLRDAVRDSDTGARLGGDALGMCLVARPLVRSATSRTSVPAGADTASGGKNKISQTSDAGRLVEISSETARSEELLAAQTAACYVAKKQGRRVAGNRRAGRKRLPRHTGRDPSGAALAGLRSRRIDSALYQRSVPALCVRYTGGPCNGSVSCACQDDDGTK